MTEEQAEQLVWTKTGQWEGPSPTNMEPHPDCWGRPCRQCYVLVCPWRTETSWLQGGGGQK